MKPRLLALALAIPLGAQDTRSLLRDLGGDDYATRMEAYRTLQRTRPENFLDLMPQLAPQFDLSSQRLAMYLLLGYRGEEAYEILELLTGSRADYLAVRSAAALWHRDEQIEHAEVIAERLGKVRDRSLRLALLGTLWGVEDPIVLAAVRDCLATSTDDLASQVQALNLLLDFSDEEAPPLVAGRLLPKAGSGSRSRLYLAYLVASGERRYAPDLAAALPDVESGEWPRIAYYLERSADLDPEVLQAVAAQIGEHEGQAAREILGVLRVQGHQEAVSAIRALVRSDDPELAKAAIGALTDLGEPVDRKLLSRMLRVGSDEQRLFAADTLRRLDDASGLPAVAAVALRPGSEQSRALRLLGEFRSRSAAAPLLEAMESARENVRAVAAYSLESLLHRLFPYRSFDLIAAGFDPEAEDKEREKGLKKIRAVLRKLGIEG